jgi:hypothetical protein
MRVFKKFSEGCTLFDAVLNVYLSLNLIPQFILDNDIKDLDIVTTAGQEFIFETDLIQDEFLSRDVIVNDYKFNTGKLFVNTAVQANFLLIESGEILQTDANEFFLI